MSTGPTDVVAGWTRETAAAALARWAVEHGQPTYDGWSPKIAGMPARATIEKLWGQNAWRKALAAAGLPAPGRGHPRGPVPGHISIMPRCACGARRSYDCLRCVRCRWRDVRAARRLIWARIAQLRQEGLLNYEIAERLGTSVPSIATHVSEARKSGFEMPPSPYLHG